MVWLMWPQQLKVTSFFMPGIDSWQPLVSFGARWMGHGTNIAMVRVCIPSRNVCSSSDKRGCEQKHHHLNSEHDNWKKRQACKLILRCNYIPSWAQNLYDILLFSFLNSAQCLFVHCLQVSEIHCMQPNKSVMLYSKVQQWTWTVRHLQVRVCLCLDGVYAEQSRWIKLKLSAHCCATLHWAEAF